MRITRLEHENYGTEIWDVTAQRGPVTPRQVTGYYRRFDRARAVVELDFRASHAEDIVAASQHWPRAGRAARLRRELGKYTGVLEAWRAGVKTKPLGWWRERDERSLPGVYVVAYGNSKNGDDRALAIYVLGLGGTLPVWSIVRGGSALQAAAINDAAAFFRRAVFVRQRAA
jgi:hypothetical protein